VERFRGLERFFGLDETGWARHANPWSVWTRAAILPALTLAIWSRDWIGWWCLIPVLAIVFFAKANPRLFPAVDRNEGWVWAAVMGEKLWVAGDPRIAQTNLHWAGLFTILQAPAVALWLTGLVFQWPLLTVIGVVAVLGAKLLFLIEMTKIYRALDGA
jgi:hypothetical protein